MGLLVIFGAGASFDSISTEAIGVGNPVWRPPLAVQLFEDRFPFNEALSRFPQFSGRVTELRRKAKAGGLDVEHELEVIRNEATMYPPARAELAALQFYLRDVLWNCGVRWRDEATGVTNYRELLSRIDRWRRPRDERVVMVNFNYDPLLDFAAQGFPLNMQLSHIDGYVSRDDYKILRPHGAANWSQLLTQHADRNLSDDEIRTRMIERASELTFSDEYAVTVGVKHGDRLAYPAISIPVENKSEFACPRSHLDVLMRSLTAWRERRQRVDDMQHVLVIGWRGSENHFLELLRGNLEDKRVLVVAESETSAEVTAANLARAGVKRDSVICSTRPGFSAFLATPELERFLMEGSEPPTTPPAETHAAPAATTPPPTREEYLNTAANRVHRRWTWCQRCQTVHLSSRWAAGLWQQCPNPLCAANGTNAVQWEAYERAHIGLLAPPFNQPGDGEYRPESRGVPPL